jgi:hypothetical protein
MPADLLAGCYGTGWNPKDPVALVTDYRCCSEGMRRDRMEPHGRPLGLLITQRSRVQIPPPPPLLSRAFVLHLPYGWVALWAVVSGGVRDHGSGPLLRALEDEVGNGRGRVLVHAGDDMAVGLEGEGDAGVARRSLITLAEIPAFSAAVA